MGEPPTLRTSFRPSLRVQAGSDSLSSFGGVAYLRDFEQRTALLRPLLNRLEDSRSTCRVSHRVEDLLRLAVYSRVLGFPDIAAADHLRFDPVLRSFSLRGDKIHGDPLAGKSTLHRFLTETLAQRANRRALTEAVLETGLRPCSRRANCPVASTSTSTPPRSRSTASRKARATTGTSRRSATTLSCSPSATWARAGLSAAPGKRAHGPACRRVRRAAARADAEDPRHPRRDRCAWRLRFRGSEIAQGAREARVLLHHSTARERTSVEQSRTHRQAHERQAVHDVEPVPLPLLPPRDEVMGEEATCRRMLRVRARNAVRLLDDPGRAPASQREAKPRGSQLSSEARASRSTTSSNELRGDLMSHHKMPTTRPGDCSPASPRISSFHLAKRPVVGCGRAGRRTFERSSYSWPRRWSVIRDRLCFACPPRARAEDLRSPGAGRQGVPSAGGSRSGVAEIARRAQMTLSGPSVRRKSSAGHQMADKWPSRRGRGRRIPAK